MQNNKENIAKDRCENCKHWRECTSWCLRKMCLTKGETPACPLYSKSKEK